LKKLCAILQPKSFEEMYVSLPQNFEEMHAKVPRHRENTFVHVFETAPLNRFFNDIFKLALIDESKGNQSLSCF